VWLGTSRFGSRFIIIIRGLFELRIFSTSRPDFCLHIMDECSARGLQDLVVLSRVNCKNGP
jgi:hypothetical protein